MTGRHLVLGSLTDYLTGQPLVDTHDERYRQKVLRCLIDQKGFRKNDIRAAIKIKVSAGNKTALVSLDFAIYLKDVPVMIVKYGPGSLTTRHRSALAMGRLMGPFQVPRVVVTNGEAVELLDGISGKMLGQGFEALPNRETLLQQTSVTTPSVSPRVAEMAARIVYAFEVDGACFCG